MMNKEKKKTYIEEMKKFFTSRSSVFITHYQGLNVKQLDQLRDEMRKHGILFRITKNRITKLALKETKYKKLENLFTGPTAVAFSDDAITSAKILTKFAKANSHLKIIGGIWLVIYGLNKIIKINNSKYINKKNEIDNNLKKILITLFLITYANPHVYLDTVILIGSISTTFESQLFFGIGAIIASFTFFFSLGYLSKFLSKYIYSEKTWFWIDLTIGFLMISYGLKFIFF